MGLLRPHIIERSDGMPSYITVGANDVPRSGRFYTAILTPLGYEKKEAANGVGFTSPDVPGWVSVCPLKV